MSDQPTTTPRTRTDAAVHWLGWHLGELAAVGLPLVLAVTVTWWFGLLALLIGAGWAAHEARQVRAQRAARQSRPQRQLPAADAPQTITDTREEAHRGTA
jgi:hypothetical protein